MSISSSPKWAGCSLYWWFISVTQLCPTLCDPMNHSTLGLPVHHKLPEFIQTHVHRVYPAISSSVVPFSSCPQFLPASGSFPVGQLFASGSESIGVSASISVPAMDTQDSSPLGWIGWISLQSKGLSSLLQQFSSVQSFSHVRLFATPWIAARQASLSITNSGVYSNSSSHLIFCCPLFLLPPIPPRIRVFSSGSTLRMR